MATGKITKASVSAMAKPTRGKLFLWDDRVLGFGIFSTATGTKSYVVQYRMGGRGTPTRRYTIGKHGSPWTPEAARERALELLYEIRQGSDPLLRERSTKDAAKLDEKLKLANYLPIFMEHHVEKKKLRSANQIRATFERDILPQLGERNIGSLKRKDILNHLEAVGKRSTSAAVSVFAQLRTFFNFARKRDDIAVSPMDGIDKPADYAPRSRVLWDWELQRAWESAEDIGGELGILLKILLLTGQRLNEVGGMMWSEIDLGQRRWTIPKERSKNKREHVVPLSSATMSLLTENWPQSKRHGILFKNAKGEVFNSFANLKAYYDAQIARRLDLANQASPDQPPKVIEPFVFHDLRRSVATGLQRLGVPIEHTEAVLNHVSGTRSSLVDRYQVYRYDAEKAEALEKWACHMQSLLGRADAWPGGKSLPILPKPKQERPKRRKK